MNDEARILRSRMAGSIAELDRLVSPMPSGSQKFLGTIVAPGSGVSLLPDHYVSAYETSIDGAESEGGTVTFTQDTSKKILGIVLGLAPVAGDRLVFTSHDGRWIARKRGSGGIPPGPYVTIPTCFCTAVPETLTMTSADEACNFGMFQSCTLQWQATPSWAAPLSLGPNIFLSTASFPDPVGGGALFYYYLICHTNTFTLTRLYPTSPFGSPFRDAQLYTWSILGPDAASNSCDSDGSDFHMNDGAAFPGSDLSCSVRIDGP